MNLRKYQNNIGKKIIKKNSYLQFQKTNNNNSMQQMNGNELNNSHPLNYLKGINNSIYKDKSKKKIQIKIINKPFKLANGINTLHNNIRNNYISKLSKNKNNDSSLMNLSNELYNAIDLGRNAINNIINLKNETKIKVKEKTPYKNKLLNNQENKENYHTNIIKTKQKFFYKTKTTNNLNNIKTNKIKNNANNDNYKYLIFNRNNNLLKSSKTTKEHINNISQRLFKKLTISSKSKTKKTLLYTPKKNLNINNKYSKFSSKTVHRSAKKIFKDLLTSQNSQSRFYINKLLSPKEENLIKAKSKNKRGSMYTKINYAYNNIKQTKDISIINTIKNSELKQKDEIGNINYDEKIKTELNKTNNKINKNKIEIHNYLYHKINSILSSELIINESKGIISTKCPLEHITNYSFIDFYSKFRAIPDNNIQLICFICKLMNNYSNIFFCEKCYNFLCSTCILKHGKKNLGHNIISLQNINTYCSIHNKKYNSFCFDCNRNSCELCHYSNEKKNHRYKTFSGILSQFKSEEKSIIYIQNEIRNQLKSLNDFIERYEEDIKKNEHGEILRGYFNEYINYFQNILKLKEKFISKYNVNENNYYNLMNVLNLSLPVFYDYNKESLFKLSRTNFIYDKYLIINDFINFVNDNSINIFEGNQNYKKYNTNFKKVKLIRSIKPSKFLNLINDNSNKNNIINNNKYPKQILDLEYNGYFLLLKDHDFDIYDKDLIFIKNFNFTNIFGNSYNEVIIGTKILENKNMAIFNYKKLLIIEFNYDFSSYEIKNKFELKINGICYGLNNFGFDDETYEIQNPLINNIIDINKSEIISLGIRFEEKYIGTIWQKNKKSETQILDINSSNKKDIYNIKSVLKYNENRFAILEKNNDIYYNVKIYSYESPYNNNKEETIYQFPSKEIEETQNDSIINKYNYINDISYNNIKIKTSNENNYEKDEKVSSEDDSEENVDKIIQEMKYNAEKKEEEYLNSIKKDKEDIIIIRRRIFNEIFNLEKIKYKSNNSDSISLIKINDKLFSFLDNENIIIVNFETCLVVSKINYGLNNLIYIDKTPNDNLLFKEKNKIISYHIKNNDLIKINLPVFEYNSKGKNMSKWYLISGNDEFIHKAKIINNNFMICLMEFRLEKWSLKNNDDKNI